MQNHGEQKESRIVKTEVVAVLTEFKQVRVETAEGLQYVITEKTPGIDWRLLREGQFVECRVTSSALPSVLEAHLYLPVPPRTILFLDVDGVLHSLNGRTFERIQLLVEWLRKHPKVKLVLSSSIREHGGLARLSSALPADVRPMLVGQTPVLRQALGAPPIKHVRQREILLWLETSAALDATYAVLDDDPRLFEPAWAPLVLCDPSVALMTRNLKSVETRLKFHDDCTSEKDI